MINSPYPTLDDLLKSIGVTGRHLANIGASEGAAGNISVCVRWTLDLNDHFPVVSEMVLPQDVPELEGATIIVSGTGCRLREIIDDPTSNLVCVEIAKGGHTGIVHKSSSGRNENVTSEFNSHLAVHYDQILATGTNFHAVVHAQPMYLTFLSHISRYQNEKFLNKQLLRWQPEAIINFPEGIGFIPFHVPSSPELMSGNVAELKNHRLVIWSKHGVMARSDTNIKKAGDLVEYAETAAKYEYLNLGVGEIGEGISVEDIHSICQTFSIKQDIF